MTFWTWNACKTNRDDEKQFFDIDPSSKAGNKPISEALALKIAQM